MTTQTKCRGAGTRTARKNAERHDYRAFLTVKPSRIERRQKRCWRKGARR